MISWKEKEPDFAPVSVQKILASVPFPLAFVVLSSTAQSPLVIFPSTVRKRILDHLASSQRELGGLLVGRVAKTPSSRSYVVAVEDSVIAKEFDSSSVSLTMNSTIWEDARNQISTDRFVIGWYHSHPNLGAFFSGTDRKTQREFFNREYHLGLVIDPVRNEERWFYGSESGAVELSNILRPQARA